MGLPWDAYYVLSKADVRLTNSKVHPNSGAPNYNIAHNVSDLFADADLHLGEHSLSADEISSNTYNFSEDDGMEFTIADHTLTFTIGGETPLVVTADGIDVDELLIGGADVNGLYLAIDGSNANANIDIGAHSFTTGTLTLAGATITDSSGAISFGNENLATTGTMAWSGGGSANANTAYDHSQVSGGIHENWTTGAGSSATFYTSSYGTFGSSYTAEFGNDDNSRAGYLMDGTREVVICDGSYGLYAYDGTNTAYLATGSYAGEFIDGSHTVYLADGSEAVYAYDGTYYAYLAGGRGGEFTDGNMYVYLTDGSSAIYAYDGYSTVYIGDGSYSVNADGEIYAYKFTESGGGYDPTYVLYDAKTREEIVKTIRLNVPPEKQDGATLFFNKNTKKMETYVASEGKFYDLAGEQLHTLPKPVVGKKHETLFHFDRMTGKIVPHQRATEPLYRLKDGNKLDTKTGKVYDADQNEVQAADVIELTEGRKTTSRRDNNAN